MRPLYPGTKVRVRSDGRCGYVTIDNEKVYVIKSVKIYNGWRTEVVLEGFDMPINSACVEIVD